MSTAWPRGTCVSLQGLGQEVCAQDLGLRVAPPAHRTMWGCPLLRRISDVAAQSEALGQPAQVTGYVTALEVVRGSPASESREMDAQKGGMTSTVSWCSWAGHMCFQVSFLPKQQPLAMNLTLASTLARQGPRMPQS